MSMASGGNDVLVLSSDEEFMDDQPSRGKKKPRGRPTRKTTQRNKRAVNYKENSEYLDLLLPPMPEPRKKTTPRKKGARGRPNTPKKSKEGPSQLLDNLNCSGLFDSDDENQSKLNLSQSSQSSMMSNGEKSDSEKENDVFANLRKALERREELGSSDEEERRVGKKIEEEDIEEETKKEEEEEDPCDTYRDRLKRQADIVDNDVEIADELINETMKPSVEVIATCQRSKRAKMEPAELAVTVTETENSDEEPGYDSLPSPPRRGKGQAKRKPRKTKVQAALFRMENDRMRNTQKANGGNDSDVEVEWSDDEDIEVKVLLHNVVHRITQKKKDTFHNLKKQMAEKAGIPNGVVFLSLKESCLANTDTPMSLNLHAGHIIDAVVSSTYREKHDEPVDAVVDLTQESVMELNFQTSQQREKKLLKVKSSTTVAEMIELYKKELSRPVHVLKLRFDGEDLEMDDTPESLDLEGGECVDVIIKSDDEYVPPQPKKRKKSRR